MGDTYEAAVDFLELVPMTSPGNFILGGLSENQGVVITRDIDSVDHKFELSEEQWFVAMTNVDVWSTHDDRYENAVTFMKELGPENVEPDGRSIIEQVLWRDGVIQDDSIFTATISADPATPIAIFDAPSYQMWPQDANGNHVWLDTEILQ